MKHRESNLPEIRARGGEIIDPMNADRVLEELASPDRKRLFLELRRSAREVAREIIPKGDTFSVGRGNRAPDQGGYQALATYFNIETWPEEPEVTWTENAPFLRSHRRGEDVPPGVAPVPEHVSATIVVNAMTPWGHHIQRQGACSSRGKHFWHSSGGQLTNYNLKKYRSGAEHICIGIAETRALARAVKAALMLGNEQFGDGEFDEDAYQERQDEKRKRSRRFDLQQRWNHTLSKLGVSPDQEEAFRLAADRLPDHEEDWSSEDFEYALKWAKAEGLPIFVRAEKKVFGAGDPPEEDEPDPPADPEESPEPKPEPEATDPPADPPEEENEPEENPAEQRQRKALTASIDGVCKALGEDRTRAETYAGDRWGDGTPIPLEELSLEDLARVDKAMSADLANSGP